MILNQTAAQAVKDAIDAEFPLWRQVGTAFRDSARRDLRDPAKKDLRFRSPEDPPIIVIRLGGIAHAVAAGSSNSVFGAGHLSQDNLWTPEHGCAVKGSSRILDGAGGSMIHGFIHIHRLGTFTPLPDVGGPEREAISFFRSARGVFSAFFPIVFSRDNGLAHPWRATPRRTDSF